MALARAALRQRRASLPPLTLILLHLSGNIGLAAARAPRNKRLLLAKQAAALMRTISRRYRAAGDAYLSGEMKEMAKYHADDSGMA